MITDPEKARHWRYYLLLQADLATSFRFVEPDPRNDAVFSLEFAKQLVAIGAQFETVARLLCTERLGTEPAKIGPIREYLLRIAPDLIDAEVTFLLRNEPIFPFKAWTAATPPAWWRAYNKLKHNPAQQLTGATLENTRDALAALGILTQMYGGMDNTGQYRNLFALSWAYGR